VKNFEDELDAWVQHTLSKAYNGKAAPRLVLVSPIAYEDLSAKRDLPKGDKENANLILYSAAVETVAKKRGLTFIDLFSPTKALYDKTEQPLTTGGFVPNEEGYQQIAEILATGMFGHQSRESKADPKACPRSREGERLVLEQRLQHPQRRPHPRSALQSLRPAELSGRSEEDPRDGRLRDTLIHDVATAKRRTSPSMTARRTSSPKCRRTTSRA
jgi:hypothetical protein